MMKLTIFVLCFSQISGQLKSLQIVASLTAERDGETRKAALNALATGYKILGIKLMTLDYLISILYLLYEYALVAC